MNSEVRPGNWPGMIVVMDNIPIQCPECLHDVSLHGSINAEKGEFQVTPCPHCGVKMEISITTETGEEEAKVKESSPLDKMAVTIGVKGLPGLSECIYVINGMSTVFETIDRTVNILSTIFASQEMNPNSIKDIYVRELISSYYTAEGKKSLIEALEAQVGGNTKD
jgi:hypothetical protein